MPLLTLSGILPSMTTPIRAEYGALLVALQIESYGIHALNVECIKNIITWESHLYLSYTFTHNIFSVISFHFMILMRCTRNLFGKLDLSCIEKQT